MANFDGGHVAKRMKTEPEGRREQSGFYNYGGGNQRRGDHSDQRGGDDESKVNHILLMTVINPSYPITVDIIHTIASPLGKVLRIVIFKKNGVQAMVEFEDVDAARRAKQSLNGADIYSGCCTLKIEYAKPERLNVHRNDNESWDYTNPNLGKTPRDGPRQGPLLQDPPARYGGSSGGGGGGYRDQAPHYSPRGSGRPGPDDGYSPRGGGSSGPPPRNGGSRDDYDSYGGGAPNRDYADRYDDDGYGGPPHDRYGGRDSYRNGAPRGGPPHGGSYSRHDSGMDDQSNQGGVVMVYGMNAEKMNCDLLFNLLCLYGNVIKVKFLKSKEGCAMVQMGDPGAVERTINNLNNVQFFGKNMQLGFSKQNFLNDVMNPYDLSDGTQSFKNYFNSRNNRFMNAGAASKNRIACPGPKLHYFNTPFGINEEELCAIFTEAGVNPPTTIKMFTSKTERSSSGIMEFESVTDGVEAVVACNHKLVTHKNAKFPFVMKLCFSAAPSRT